MHGDVLENKAFLQSKNSVALKVASLSRRFATAFFDLGATVSNPRLPPPFSDSVRLDRSADIDPKTRRTSGIAKLEVRLRQMHCYQKSDTG